MPTLSLTNGSRHLAYSILGLPGTGSTPVDNLRIGRLMEVLEEGGMKAQHEIDAVYANAKCDVEVTESQRELLKHACTVQIKAIPNGRHASNLLEAVGFKLD